MISSDAGEGAGQKKLNLRLAQDSEYGGGAINRKCKHNIIADRDKQIS